MRKLRDLQPRMLYAVIVLYSSVIHACYPLVWYILKQLFTEVQVKSGKSLRRR